METKQKNSFLKAALNRPEAAVTAVLIVLIAVIGIVKPRLLRRSQHHGCAQEHQLFLHNRRAPYPEHDSRRHGPDGGAVTSLGGVVCATCLMAGIPSPIAIIIAPGLRRCLRPYKVLCHRHSRPSGLQSPTLGLRYAIDGAILVFTRVTRPSSAMPATPSRPLDRETCSASTGPSSSP